MPILADRLNRAIAGRLANRLCRIAEDPATNFATETKALLGGRIADENRTRTIAISENARIDAANRSTAEKDFKGRSAAREETRKRRAKPLLKNTAVY